MMTFSQLIGELERRFPGMERISVEVEFHRNKNTYRCCSHESEYRSSLQYRVWIDKDLYEARTPEQIFQKIEEKDQKNRPVADEELVRVDAHTVATNDDEKQD